jgi:uncharacterized protein YecE (DUF72 family)
MAGRTLVGTAGWEPPDPASWYPPGVPPQDRLTWYAERFGLIEVNTTFHAVPPRDTVERWLAATPDGFVFDVKLHRLLSHHAAPPETLPEPLRRVSTNNRGNVIVTPDLVEALAEHLLTAIASLIDARRLGALLLQLSPSFAPDRHPLEELDRLLDLLSPYRVALELRNRAWLDDEREDETLEWLEDRHAAYVCVEPPPGEALTHMPALDAVTRRDLAYLRVLGRAEPLSPTELPQIAARARNLALEADEVHVVIVANARGEGLVIARRLRGLLGEDPPPLDAAAPGQLTLPEA